MSRRALSILTFIAALGLASEADARPPATNLRLVLKAGRLADALTDLSIRSGSNLLFAPDVVGELRNQRVAGAMDVEQALHRLLDGTGLGFRHMGAGTYIVFRVQQDQPTALPEILIVGRKTQNADIRRTENDIQAYRVVGAEDLRSSHANNLDQFLRSRQPSNAQRSGPAQDPSAQYGSSRSEVDLHGLGSNQTLVLVDGARMPGVPSLSGGLEIAQPDLNGLPILAIERIESLTGTAGGIYGPGATGGVINVILRRDYRGAEVSATYGLTDRGDAPVRRLDARIGFTPDDGRTDVMINLSRAVSDGLRAGDRQYGSAARQLLIARDPQAYVQGFPVVDGVLIRSASGEVLTLSPALGAAALGSNLTYLPAGHGGVGDGAVLLAGAGQVPSALATGGSGLKRSLTSDTTVSSVLVNVRHRFSEHVEAFIDFIGYENESRSLDGNSVSGRQIGAVASSGYPFQQRVTVSFPLPGYDATVSNRLRTTRASVGAIVRLPATWRAEATYSDGMTRNHVRSDGYQFNEHFLEALSQGRPGAGGEPTPNPFAPWNDFVAALQAYKVKDSIRIERKARLQDFSLRLGGPLVRREAGDIALSVVAEHRKEHVSIFPIDRSLRQRRLPEADASFSLAVSSVYGELRAPIVPRGSDLTPLRGLEIQLAARYDDNQSEIPGNSLLNIPTPRVRYNRSGAVYTAGLRVFPLNHLLVRASVATGELPPTPEQVLSTNFNFSLPADYVYAPDGDPKRGGRTVGTEKPFVLLGGGSTRLRAEKAQTLAIGAVLNPDGGRWPRVSIDFTHVEKHGEISAYHGEVEYFLTNESVYPDRIVRDPLTPADAAAGYSGGVITQIDATYLNVGKTVSDAVDMTADYSLRFANADRLRLYGSVTWTPRLTRQWAPDLEALDFIGTNAGPLEWRGNAGAAWDHGNLTLSLNGQYYDSYFAMGGFASSTEKVPFDRPGLHIPARIYLDAAMSYRPTIVDGQGRVRDLDIRFGVQNLLDRSAPVAVDSELGYSFYGDPRGRRFELSLTTRF